jgi:anti-sigma regulatory factor (Ser/Thr protein kinase)
VDGHAGLGLFLIKQLVDEVEFSSKPQGGQVRMVIYLEPEGAHDE